MKKTPSLLLLLAALFFPISVRATAEDEEQTEKVPIDIVETETAYVFESDLNHGGSFGKQYELQNSFEYGHRFFLKGNLYARLGVAYERFDFGNTAAPVPVHLQRMAGIISIDYMHGKDIGALLEFRPGFYTEEHIGLASFDCPITLARFFILQQDKFYVLVGAQAKFLRGGFPVIPFAGFVWYPNEKIRVMAIVPEPRVIYSVSRQLDLWLGGELVGGSFRTDHHNEFLNIPHVAKLSGTQVDYSDYRAGAGLTYSLVDQIDLDLGAGYSIQRSFNFHRAGEYYRTDPAPYVRFEIKAKF
ncbi:MAG: hypothetical protein M3R29_01260 [Verrucomicrobiota bacterium]|nr:hypothetical protein [Verrucomicrobiota bacterium]